MHQQENMFKEEAKFWRLDRLEDAMVHSQKVLPVIGDDKHSKELQSPPTVKESSIYENASRYRLMV